MFYQMNRIDTQNTYLNHQHHIQNAKNLIKIKQTEYINLIQDLHSENHRLKSLLSQKEDQIKCFKMKPPIKFSYQEPNKFASTIGANEKTRPFIPFHHNRLSLQHPKTKCPRSLSPFRNYSQSNNQRDHDSVPKKLQKKFIRVQENPKMQNLPTKMIQESSKYIFQTQKQYIEHKLQRMQEEKQNQTGRLIIMETNPFEQFIGEDVNQQYLFIGDGTNEENEKGILQKEKFLKINDHFSATSLERMLLKYGDKKKKGKMTESPLYRYGMGLKRKQKKGHEKGRSSSPFHNANGISNRIYL